jgi:glycosyltransferase involved in cell wall biosynthesis
MRVHKLLFLIESLNIGGTEVFLEKLISRLDTRRFEPLVCCLVEKGKLAPQIEAKGVRVVALGWRLRSMVSTIIIVARLAQLLRKEKIDLIQTFFYRAEILGAMASVLARKPVVVGSQRDIIAPGRKISQSLLRLSRQCVRHVIANCEACRRYRQMLTGHNPREISIVYIGLTEEELSLRLTGKQSVIAEDFFEKGPVVTYAGRLHNVKGPDVFLRAAALVYSNNPEVKFLMIGDGRMRAELVSLTNELGLSAAVCMPGEIRPVKGIFQKSSVVVCSSRSEGFPNVVLEAMAVGAPVVASRVGGVEELINNREDGFLFESENSEELASIIMMLLSDREGAAEVGSRAREKVSKRFRFDETVAQIESLYTRLLSKAG